MACPECKCKVHYGYYEDDMDSETTLERCANCGHIFDIEMTADDEDYEPYVYCKKCKQPADSDFCEKCHYPGIEEIYEEYQNMLAEGYRQCDAAVRSGWMGAEEI